MTGVLSFKRSLSAKLTDQEKRISFGKDHAAIRQQVSHHRKECHSSLSLIAQALQDDHPAIALELQAMLKQSDIAKESKKSAGERLMESANHIAAEVESVKSHVNNADRGKSLDLVALQSRLQDVSEKIHDVKLDTEKESNRLKTEEARLTSDLRVLQKDMHLWSRCDHGPAAITNGTHSPAKSRKLSTRAISDKPQAVLDFDKYLALHGGSTGGWDDFDHKEYLSFRQRRGAVDEALAEEAACEIPTKTPDDIIAHEHWYAKFAALSAARKEALIGWKQEKEAKATLRADELRKEEQRKLDLRNQGRQIEQRKRKLTLTGLKAEKERQDRIQAEAAARQQLEQDSMNRQKFREHRASLKQRLDQHYGQLDRQLTDLQLEQERKLQDVKEQRHKATLQVHEIGARELLRAEQRALLKLEEKQQQLSRQAQQERFADGLRRKVSESVPTDRSRLTRPTRGWVNRLVAGGDGMGSDKAGGWGLQDVLQKWLVPANVFDLHKLATPSWRKQSGKC